ncbi:MAG: DUF5686 family protein, partial [Saprospiraceae bacterium]
MRLAVKNKKLNNHEKLNSYTCNVYTKTQVSPIISDSTKYFNHLAERKLRKKDTTQIKKDSFSIYDFHPLQSEVVTKRLFKKPKIVQTKLIHSRVAGMKKMDFSAINYFQQFTCYENYIQFLDTDYLNPISVGSTRQYYFNIEDTLYQQTDTVFIISYKPRKNKKFEALEGTVYINSNGYAVQNIIAEPAGNKHSKWRLEHQYQFLEEKRWFPSQLNFEMRLVAPTGYSESVIRQKSYISDIEINPKLTFQELKNNYVPLTKEVTTKADSVWNKYRPEALDSKEMDSYILVDSLGKEMKLDAIVKGATSVGTGRLNVKGIDIRINDVLRFNNYETVRLGIGLQTNKDLSRYFSVGGYFGYGFKDKGIKYGGNLVIDIIPDDILELEWFSFLHAASQHHLIAMIPFGMGGVPEFGPRLLMA